MLLDLVQSQYVSNGIIMCSVIGQYFLLITHMTELKRKFLRKKFCFISGIILGIIFS